MVSKCQLKRPTSRGRARDQEAAVQRTFHFVRSGFIQLSALMVASPNEFHYNEKLRNLFWNGSAISNAALLYVTCTNLHYNAYQNEGFVLDTGKSRIMSSAHAQIGTAHARHLRDAHQAEVPRGVMVKAQCYSQGEGQGYGRGMDISVPFFFLLKVTNFTFVLPSQLRLGLVRRPLIPVAK